GGSPFTEISNNVIGQRNTNEDLLLGNTATNSAKFAFENVGAGVPTASLSAGANNNTFLTANGTLGTTNRQTLTIGGASSGNVVLNAGSGVIQLANNNIQLTGSTPIISATVPNTPLQLN